MLNNMPENYFKIDDNNTSIVYEFLDECEKIDRAIGDVWREIITANLSGAMDKINKLFGKFEIILKHIDSINMISNFKIDSNIIFKKFIVLEEAMKIPDYVYIADILKYEIDILIKEWKQDVIRIFKIVRN